MAQCATMLLSFKKRSIADRVPLWNKNKCIQCNTCSFVCPHATIRPVLMDDDEYASAPDIVKDDYLNAMGPGLQGLKFRIQVSNQELCGMWLVCR